MGLLGAVTGGLLGGGIGAFSNNPWQGWGQIGSWAMNALPGALAGGALGAGVGYGIESMFSQDTETPEAPPPPSRAPRSLLDYDDPAEAPTVREAEKKTRAAVGAMRGRGSTLLTGPSGLKPDDESRPGLLRRTLGGA